MIARSGNVDIYCEASGPADGEAILLIPGQGHQAPDWDAEFTDHFSNAGYRVVTMDNRDSGESTFFPGAVDLLALASGKNVDVPYRLDDMAGDAIAVLDAFDLRAAHIFGHSMGAMIAQLVALDYPERVLSLTCLAGSTGARKVGQAHEGIAELLIARSTPGLTQEQKLDAAVAASSAWSSPNFGATAEAVRQRIVKRGKRNQGSGGSERQLAAVLTASDRTERLRAIAVPTLVMHGTDDPLVDRSGSEATAIAVPNATLRTFEGMKHDIPPGLRDQIAKEVLRHIQAV